MLSYRAKDVKDQVVKSRMGANIGRSLYKEKKGITSQSYIWYDTPDEPVGPSSSLPRRRIVAPYHELHLPFYQRPHAHHLFSARSLIPATNS